MIVITAEGRLIVIKMTGMVTDADWEEAVPQFEEALGGQASVRLVSGEERAFRLLMDWERLHGWEKGARSGCTWFCRANQDLVDRIAIVGDQTWQDEESRLADVYRDARVRFFVPSEREVALGWLNSD